MSSGSLLVILIGTTVSKNLLFYFTECFHGLVESLSSVSGKLCLLKYTSTIHTLIKHHTLKTQLILYNRYAAYSNIPIIDTINIIENTLKITRNKQLYKTYRPIRNDKTIRRTFYNDTIYKNERWLYNGFLYKYNTDRNIYSCLTHTNSFFHP